MKIAYLGLGGLISSWWIIRFSREFFELDPYDLLLIGMMFPLLFLKKSISIIHSCFERCNFLLDRQNSKSLISLKSPWNRLLNDISIIEFELSSKKLEKTILQCMELINEWSDMNGNGAVRFASSRSIRICHPGLVQKCPKPVLSLSSLFVLQDTFFQITFLRNGWIDFFEWYIILKKTKNPIN
jgi:hypothetical protein